MATKRREAPMAALGSYDSVLPFQAIGIETMVVNADNRASVPQIVAKYASDQYAVLFIEESLYADFKEAADEINESEDISVVPIPNQTGSMGIGAESLRKSAERAVGMDIFSVK
ncbi:MAG: V-type ATP synthase subunit F [Synergistaceae bacterium]|jgi:V/A-type H+-transporting ATPase subunit F|nr:V-type ATP synthase subunit F [Synergistaceae bacterium]